MKETLAFICGIMIIVGGLMFVNYNSDLEVTNELEEEEITIEEIPEKWQTDEEAVQAAKDVIQRKEWEAELAELEAEDVERQARMTELEKELGTY